VGGLAYTIGFSQIWLEVKGEVEKIKILLIICQLLGKCSLNMGTLDFFP
jgi:hypothetical protein